MVKVCYISNLFETERYEFESNNSTIFAIILSLVHKFPEVRKDGVGFQIRVNGQLIPSFKWRTKLKDGDSVLIIQEIGWEAIVIAATWIISAAITAWPFVSAAFALASIAYSIYSILTQRNTTDTGEGLEGSKTYGWEGAQMRAEPGIPVQVIYGEHLVSGNAIGSYVSTDGDKTYFNLLLEISEGPIEGIMKYDQSGVCGNILDNPFIMINDNFLSNIYGDDFWYMWDYRLGNETQELLPGFFDTKTLYDLGSPKISKSGGPYLYTTEGDDIEGFEVRVRIPQLYWQSRGNYNAITMDFRIWHSIHGEENWVYDGYYAIKAATLNPIRRYYRIDGLAPNRYDIRIEKWGDDLDPENPELAGNLYLDSITEIKYAHFTYPFTALLALKTLATNKLSAEIPNIKVLVRGRKVKNLKTSNIEWSQNPIYCVHDLLTNKRYGAGQFISIVNINTDRMIEEADYCDEMVGNGTLYKNASMSAASNYLYDGEHNFAAGDIGKTICCQCPTDSIVYTNLVITSVYGGFAYGTWSNGIPDPANVGWEWGEKRNQLDIVLDSQNDALSVINQMCGIFRAVPLWIKDAIELVIDRRQDPCYQMNMSNIIKSSFQDSFISPKSRPNSVEASYADKMNWYKKETIIFTDHDAIEADLPLRSIQMNFYGASRQSQVYREARFQVLAYKYQDEQLQIKGGIDSIYAKPSDVIRVQHDVPQWGYGGRIVAATIDSVILDKEIEITAGTWTLRIRQKDAVTGLDTIENRIVSNEPGFYTVLDVTENFSVVPEIWSTWNLGKTGNEPKMFRTMMIKRTAENEVELLASEYHPSVYTDTGLVLTEALESGLPNPFVIAHVTNLSVTERGNILSDGNWSIYLQIGFMKPESSTLLGWDHTEIWISLAEDSGWEYYGNAKETGYKVDSHDFLNIDNVVYIKAVSVSANGMRAPWETAPMVSVTILGKTTPPSDVTGFTATQFSDRIVFDWDMSEDADVKAGGYYEIRQGETWETATLIKDFIKANTFTWLTFNPGEVTLLIKAIDSSGNYSANAASVTFTITILPTGLAAMNIDALLYGVTCTDTLMQYNTFGYDRVVSLRIGTKYDDPTVQYDDGHHYDKPIDPLTGYFITPSLDIGTLARYEFVIDSEYLKEGDGQTATVQIATSENGSDWSGYTTYSATTIYYCRYVKFKVTLTTDNSTENIFCGKFMVRAYNADVLQSYTKEEGTSPNKITSICIKDENGNEIILSTMVS